jgi:IclR family transcriptional regulator, KDG regulon repressor
MRRNWEVAPVSTSEDRYRVRAVDRAIDLLEAFSIEEPQLSLGQLAEATGLSKATTFRLLTVLRGRELVQYSGETETYGLGHGVLAFSGVYLAHTNLAAVAAPHMRELRDTMKETVVLSVRYGDSRVHIVQYESLLQTQRVAKIGESVPLYIGAAGRVLLSDFSDDEIRAYLARTPLVSHGEATVTDPDMLISRVRTIRAQGFDFGNRERTSDGGGVAAPIRNAAGEIVAALHIIAPSSRLGEDHRDQYIDAVVTAAQRISSELGAVSTELRTRQQQVALSDTGAGIPRGLDD